MNFFFLRFEFRSVKYSIIRFENKNYKINNKVRKQNKKWKKKYKTKSLSPSILRAPNTTFFFFDSENLSMRSSKHNNNVYYKSTLKKWIFLHLYCVVWMKIRKMRYNVVYNFVFYILYCIVRYAFVINLLLFKQLKLWQFHCVNTFWQKTTFNELIWKKNNRNRNIK